MVVFKHRRILVVDDVEDNLFLLQFFLKTKGYDVDTACDGDLLAL